MGDLLKEAIADAKAVRETALANAKAALEEAFTPQLKSMLSAKLKEDEFEDEIPAEEEDELGVEVPAEEEEEIPAEEMGYSEEDELGVEIPAEEEDELGVEIPAEEEDELGVEIPAEEEGEEDVEETISLNGQTYKLVREEDDTEYSENEVGDGLDAVANSDEADEDNLDLESVIKELEDEIGAEEDDEETVDESEDGMEGESENVEGKEQANHVGGDIGDNQNAGLKENSFEIDNALFEEEEDAEEGDEEKVEEQSDSSDIGAGDNKVDVADGDDQEDIQGTGIGKGAGNIGDNENVALKKENRQYKEAVKFLKDKLHEVNILNAKLLFTNKLFKSFSLNNNQKLKVVETFDRAQTTREIKLVYATLAESFGDNNGIKKRKSINESASSAVSSTKPSTKSRKVISEETNVADRFRKLAGLKS